MADLSVACEAMVVSSSGITKRYPASPLINISDPSTRVYVPDSDSAVAAYQLVTVAVDVKIAGGWETLFWVCYVQYDQHGT